MDILFASAECAPFTRCGGLGDVVGSLPRALAARGHRVRVILPWYPALHGEVDIEPLGPLAVSFGGRTVTAALGRAVQPGPVEVVFVRHRGLIQTLYGGARDQHGPVTEYRRFWFFCEAVCAYLATLPQPPHILHAHDHHTALLPVLMKQRPPERRPATVLTLHNARYQAAFESDEVPAALRDDEERPLPSPHAARARFVHTLRRGLRAADAVSTVSAAYVASLLSVAAPEQLHDVLVPRAEAGDVFGILNGIDTTRYDPRTDPILPRPYDAADPAGRRLAAAALRRHVGLPPSRGPLLGFVGRLTPQKGLLLLLKTLDPLLRLGAQVVVMGDGSPKLRALLQAVARGQPSQIAYLPFDTTYETLVYAGADLLVMPSWWEPCGLTQLKGYRYGAVPVVRATGGLRETVHEYDPRSGRGTGFLFEAFDPFELHAAAARAIATWQRPHEWQALQRRVLALDHGWSGRVGAYERLYRHAARRARGHPRRAA